MINCYVSIRAGNAPQLRPPSIPAEKPSNTQVHLGIPAPLRNPSRRMHPAKRSLEQHSLQLWYSRKASTPWPCYPRESIAPSADRPPRDRPPAQGAPRVGDGPKGAHVPGGSDEMQKESADGREEGVPFRGGLRFEPDRFGDGGRLAGDDGGDGGEAEVAPSGRVPEGEKPE